MTNSSKKDTLTTTMGAREGSMESRRDMYGKTLVIIDDQEVQEMIDALKDIAEELRELSQLIKAQVDELGVYEKEQP